MVKDKLIPDYILESSWEVCNKVGGIYTVLSTRARVLHDKFGDRLIFVGPDCWKTKESPYFEEDKSLYCEWKNHALSTEGLFFRVGRWKVPGKPVAVLVDFQRFYESKNDIYSEIWEWYRVDSLHAYGDYDEASMFSYAAAKVVESFYNFCVPGGNQVVYHGNEWMTGLGLLYINHKIPDIATIFTTHATSIGRSIAGNNKPLYNYLDNYNGDQMASELNMQSKHSVEKQTAKYVDCFTTVSGITARECEQLLDKPVDVVLPNGFDDDFVPKGLDFTKKRREARKRLFKIANALTGCHFEDDTLIISTSGRYEYRNKGIDVFVDSMHGLSNDGSLKRNVLAFIEVPAWVYAPRLDLAERLKSQATFDEALEQPVITHWLHEMDNDNVIGQMRYLGMGNAKNDKVKVVFIPCYLVGDDGIVNIKYYDLVLGNDLSVFPSYYEPWGYTPLESVAFKVPCVTTDLAGFGLWANGVIGHDGKISDGVEVVHRDDYNFSEVSDAIKDAVLEYSRYDEATTKKTRQKAENISKLALWSRFIKYYYDAYSFALEKKNARIK